MGVLAIDFGTTHTLAAECLPNSLPLVLEPRQQNARIMKTVLFATGAKDWFVGSQALQMYDECFGEGRYFRSIKKYLPDPAFTHTVVFGKVFKIQDIIAKFLATIKDRAESQTGVQFSTLVLGRPARFSAVAEEDLLAETRLREAATLVGFRHIRFCFEPVAVAYKVAKAQRQEQLMVVADLGGGTSDFTVCKMPSLRPFSAQDVLSIGAVSVAGDAFDSDLVRYQLSSELGLDITYQLPSSFHATPLPSAFVDKVSSPADFNLLASQRSWQVLEHAFRYGLKAQQKQNLRQLMTLLKDHLGYPFFREVERTKILLSQETEVQFLFDSLDVHVQRSIAQADYEQDITPNANRILTCLDETLKAAKVSPSDIHTVYCTGGTSQMPMIKNALQSRFGREKMVEFSTFDGVIQGLSVFGNQLS